jgi:hypothetical protein
MNSIFYQLQKDSSIFKSNYINVGFPSVLQNKGEWTNDTYIASLKGLIKTANPRTLKDVDEVDISMCQEGIKEFDYKSVISDIDEVLMKNENKILLVRYAEVAPVVGESHDHII